MSESEAVESLERLGLTGYEAKVFIALQKLGGGTARDVHRITDVPRSQVYSAAENLAERGLVEIQQSNPIQYRPVDIDEARETLRARFEREQERAFDYVERVRRQHDDGAEEQEAIWTVRGSDRIDERVLETIRAATDRVVLGTPRTSLVTPEIEAALREQAEAGTVVVVISESADVRERFADVEGITVAEPIVQQDEEADTPIGRIAYADDDRLVMSVLGREEVTGTSQETAIWSAETNFAAMLIEMIRIYVSSALDERDQ